MTTEKEYDEGLEEIWRIKREIAEGYANLDAYFASVLEDQERSRARGVKFVRCPASFNDLLRVARAQASSSGMTEKDVTEEIAAYRRERRQGSKIASTVQTASTQAGRTMV